MRLWRNSVILSELTFVPNSTSLYNSYFVEICISFVCMVIISRIYLDELEC